MATPAQEFFSVLTDILTAGAAVGGFIIAWVALGTWRAQIRGQATFDAAKRFMIAANELALHWHNARAPFISASEFPADYYDTDQRSRRQEQDAYRAILNKRWEPVWRAYTGVIALLPEARALFPAAVADGAESLLLIARELAHHMDQLIDLKKYDFDSMTPGDVRTRLMEQAEAASEGVFAPYPRAGADNGNALTKKFSDQHAALASLLKPYLHVS